MKAKFIVSDLTAPWSCLIKVCTVCAVTWPFINSPQIVQVDMRMRESVTEIKR